MSGVKSAVGIGRRRGTLREVHHATTADIVIGQAIVELVRHPQDERDSPGFVLLTETISHACTLHLVFRSNLPLGSAQIRQNVAAHLPISLSITLPSLTLR